jgi:hypothetical protein
MSDLPTEQLPEQNPANNNLDTPKIENRKPNTKGKAPFLPIALILISIIVLTLAIIKFKHEGTFFGKTIVPKKDTVEVTPYDDTNMDSSVMAMPIDSSALDTVAKITEKAEEKVTPIAEKIVEPAVEKKQVVEVKKTMVAPEKKPIVGVKKAIAVTEKKQVAEVKKVIAEPKKIIVEPKKSVDVVIKENQNLPSTFEAYLVSMANPTVNYDTRFESGDKYASSYFVGNASAIQVDENGNTINTMGVDEFLGVLRVNEFKIKIKDKKMQGGKVALIKFVYQF